MDAFIWHVIEAWGRGMIIGAIIGGTIGALIGTWLAL